MSECEFSYRYFYYTTSHEWIHILDTEAYIGVSQFRLANAKQIKKITFHKIYGIKKKGEVLATIWYDYQKISVHMPVDGKIIMLNDVHLLVNQKLLLSDAEKDGWIVKIRFDQPLQTEGLLSRKQYALKSKT